MPELPEVEIVKQSLKKTIIYKKIINVKVSNRNLRFKLKKNFETYLIKRKITDVLRIAKYLIIALDNNKYLIIHFGMSGTLHLLKKDKNIKNTNLSFYNSCDLPKKHNHIEFFFDNFKVIYNDPRRFGFLKIFNSRENLNKYLDNYEKEPLNKNFNVNHLKNILSSKKKNIKNILLDQKCISGIGNIYANEILFFSKINPKKLGKNLSDIDIKKLVFYSKKVLNNAILKGGSTIRNFKNANGIEGKFQDDFKVYNKKGLKCTNKNCIQVIKKITISNRSTFYCSYCQKS